MREVTAAMCDMSMSASRIGIVAGYGPLAPPLDRIAHHDVIEHVDVVVADLLDGARELPDGLGTFAIRDAGELDGQLHLSLAKTFVAISSTCAI